MRKQSNQREIQFSVHQMHILKIEISDIFSHSSKSLFSKIDDDKHWRTGVVDTSSDFFARGKMFYL
ncbi:unnamed protein product [Brassica oleracea]